MNNPVHNLLQDTQTMRIIKIADCGKLTTPDKPTLTYNISVTDANDIYFRITDNTTGGFFSTEWIALDAITECIAKQAKTKSFHAALFEKLYEQKSANNAGFLAAALMAEGLLQRFEDTKRMLTKGNLDAFTTTVEPLIDSDISLHDVVAERLELKQQQEAKRQEELAKIKQANTSAIKSNASKSKPTASTKSNRK